MKDNGRGGREGGFVSRLVKKGRKRAAIQRHGQTRTTQKKEEERGNMHELRANGNKDMKGEGKRGERDGRKEGKVRKKEKTEQMMSREKLNQRERGREMLREKTSK